MLTYFLQAHLCWLLFYGLYYVLLSKETFFRLNRIYLIISLLAGLLLPLSADWLRTETPLYIYVPMDSIMLPEFVVGMTEKAVLLPINTEGGSFLTWWTLMVSLYQVGLVVMGVRFLYGLFCIYKTFKTTTIEKVNGFLVLNTEGVLAQPFSFFNMIFIDKNQYQDIDYQNIMQHEKAHARQLHSLDVVFLELLKIVFWYSPMVYIYRHSLRNIHEYLADAAVLRSVSKKQYGTLLIQQAQSANVLALVNPFFSQLKKRIVMMTRNPSKRRSLVKYTFAVPVFLLLVSFLASPSNVVMKKTAALSEDVKNTIDNTSVPNFNIANENTENQTISNEEGTTFKVTLAGYEGGTISAEVVQKQTQFKLIQPNGKTCDVQSCSIYKQSSNGSYTEPIKNNGSIFKPEIRALFQSLQQGERLLIKSIKVRCPGDVEAQVYTNMVFDITNESKFSINGSVNTADTTKPLSIIVMPSGYIQGYISVKDMARHTEVLGMDETINIKNKLEIISFTLTRTSTNSLSLMVENQTGIFNAEIKKLVTSAKIGDIFVFSNIKMKNSAGEIILGKDTRIEINSFEDGVKYNVNMASPPILPTKTPNQEGVYTIVEQQPQFPQGQKAMFEWLGQNIKYPTKARENGVEGTVYIGFVVNKDGSLSNITIKRGISSDCNEEAVRVISAMPKWKPGMQDGKAVAVAYTLPIKFKLEQTKQPDPKGIVIIENPKADNTLFTIVDEQPQFVGGQDTMFRWLTQNIKYPKEAREKRAEGTVYVGFVVEKDGSITNVAIKREPSYPKDTLKIMEVNGIQGIKLVNSKAEGSLGREAVRVISAMPKWKAGRNQGQPVRVAYTLPIKFKLE
jgi:TonB family protein